MDDRALLERAAMAAGLTLVWGEVYMVGGDTVDCTDLPYIKSTDREEADRYWNPLTDSGDALELAVKLGLELYHTINNDCWTVFVGYPKGQRIVYIFDEWGEDEYAATRRAITRAAAALAGDERERT